MIDKVGVHLHAVFIGVQVYPFRLKVNEPIDVYKRQTESDMASVILTGTDTVELVVIQPYHLFPSCGITPHPILKALLDNCLLYTSRCV